MSKKYLLPCGCGREIPVEAAQAGQRVRCECDAELDVPTMLGLAKLQPLVEPVGAPRVRRRGWSIRHRLAFIGGVIFLAGFAGVVGLWLCRPRPLDVSQLSPVDAMAYWDRLRLGIATPQIFPYEYFRTPGRRWSPNLQWYTNWLIFSAAVALLGALIAGSAWLVGNRSRQGPAQRKGPEASE
jgi:hypothetical protein